MLSLLLNGGGYHRSLLSLNQVPKRKVCVIRIFVPILSCQCFHLKSFTCCYNLASIVHESLNWVLLLLVAAPEIGNMIWGTGEKKDDKTSQQRRLLWLICQQLRQQWRGWLSHPYQYTLILIREYYPHAPTLEQKTRNGTLPTYLPKLLLLLYTKWGWSGRQSGCQLN